MHSFFSRFSFLSVFITQFFAFSLSVAVPNGSYLRLELESNNKEITTPAGTEQIQWTVSFESSSPANLSWYNAQGIKLTSKILRSGKYSVAEKLDSTTLTVRNLTVNDTGTFTLRAETGTDEENLNVWLNVQDKPKVVLYGSSNEYLPVNKKRKIECVSVASPKPTVTWLQRLCDSYPNCSEVVGPITEGGENQINAVSLISHRMYFANHSAEITCTACNDFGCANQTKVFLVSDDVRGFKVSGPTPVVQEEDAVLSCMASKYGYHSEIRWMYRKQNDSHSSRVFNSSSKFKLVEKKNDFSYFLDLTIKNVSFNDAGIYYCMTSNDEEPLPESKGKAFSLVIKPLQAPQFITEKSNMTKQKIKTKIGGEVRMACFIDATPPANITWSKGKEQLSFQKNSRVELLDNNQLLVIHSAEVQDSGMYTCKAKNKVNSVTGWNHLKIEGDLRYEEGAASA